MKKILPYAAAAILLGTVTMLVPAMLLRPNYYYGQLASGYGKVVPDRCPEAYKAYRIPMEGGTLDGGETFGLTRSPLSNILSAGLMLIPSFLLALGVSLYLKKRVF